MSSAIAMDHTTPDDRDYWLARLSPSLDGAHLLLDYERPSSYTFDKEEVAINFSGETVERLMRLANDSPFLLYGALLAGLKACLHKYSASETIVVGSPARAKKVAQLTPAAAFPIIDHVDNRITFRQLLLNVRETLLEAYGHQNFDFAQLIRTVGLDHVTDRCPLFDVMLVLDEIHEPAGDLRNGLTLSFTRRGPELSGRATFNPKLFASQNIERLLKHYEFLLQQALKQPDAPIGQLSLLTVSERHQVVVEWNDTATPYADARCIHELFEAQVERTPEAVGLIFENEQITFAEYNRRANRLAHYLRKFGVGPEVIVGLCAERSMEMAIGVLAILKAGGAYLPLDPAYPPERLSFMLQDGNVSVLLTQARLLPTLSPGEAKVICFDTDAEAISQESTDNPSLLTWPELPAYVIYTSGSTGQPKGVVVAHQGLCNMSEAQRRVYNVRADMRVLQFASLSFDASISEMVIAWVAGAPLVLAGTEQLLADGGLIEWMRQQEIAWATLPPSVLNALPPEELPVLETILAAGEACPPELLTRWAPGRRFFNAYGPTESTVWASVAECFAGNRKAPIGRPIVNTEIYLLDEQMNPVPVGVPGELYIGGVGLARGYLRRPALTAERFVPNPFSPMPGKRLYRTGDLSRYLPDGQIEFLGRIDRQVKVRGFRIEVGEVEAAIARQAGVVQSVVMAREDVSGNQQLVAYVVSENRNTLNAGELRKMLQAKLPGFMVPSAFVFLEALPLTPNGKVDWKALPAPDASRGSLETSKSSLTPVEEVVAGIWSEVLGVESVGRDDNFLELGGHSLLATRVFSRVREAFQVELPIRTLFDAPTLAGVSHVIEKALGNTPDGAPLITRVARNGNLPASFGQHRLWLFHQLEPRSPLYNIPFAMSLSGRLNTDALEQSLAEVTRRHESLRTTFLADSGQPRQVIAQTANVKLVRMDLSQLSDTEREAESRRLMIEEALRPFDLERGPLLRATLLRMAEEEHMLLFTMHHIISDAWSLGVLSREVAELYEAYVNDESSTLPDLSIQYADYACWQRDYLAGEVLENQLVYWRAQLSGMSKQPPLPISRARTAQTHRGATEHIRISIDLTKAIRAFCRREGATLFITLLAGFKALLYRYSGHHDLVIGSPMANRTQREVEGLIGYFINTLPLRTDLSGNPTFRELLARVRQVALGAYAHQDVPLEKLISELNLERELGYAKLFPAVFVLQNAPMPAFKLTDVTLSALDVYKETTQADLYFAVVESGEELLASLKYSTDLYDGETIAKMLANFATLLEAVVARPDHRLLDIPFQTTQDEGAALAAAATYGKDQFTF